MELRLEQGDYVPNGAGGLSAAGGGGGTPSAGAFSTDRPAGTFPFLPELGSRLYQLGREKPSAREALALQYVTEALAQESELAVTGVELTETTPGRAALRTDLNWRGAPLSVAVEVRI